VSPAPLLLVTCEHAGRRIPTGFARDEALAAALETHRGWDPGALPLARLIARRLGGVLRYTTLSRLVVDPNRSEGADDLFSEWSRALPEGARRQLVRRHHRRHRSRVRRVVEGAGGPVVHVGVHTFTPVFQGQSREVDLGVLYDPARPREEEVAARWLAVLRTRFPTLKMAPNAPYDGRTDGLTTSMRAEFPDARYAGLELEVSQGLLGPNTRFTDGRFPADLSEGVAAALDEALGR